MKSIIQVLEADVVVVGQVYIGERRTATGNFSIDAADDVWGGVVSWEKLSPGILVLVKSGEILIIVTR